MPQVIEFDPFLAQFMSVYLISNSNQRNDFSNELSTITLKCLLRRQIVAN